MTDVVELYLLRHADAGDPAKWDGPDAARPLSPKGEKQSERLGRFLAGIGFRPDAILSSPKLRASQTADIVAGQLGVPVTLDERLASGVDISESKRSCATPAIHGGPCSWATTRTSRRSSSRCAACGTSR